MPLVKIDLNKDAPGERIRIVSQAVYGAMNEIANVPINDKFQIVTRYGADEIIYPEEGDLGVRYSPGLVIMGRRPLDRRQEAILPAHRRRNSR